MGDVVVHEKAARKRKDAPEWKKQLTRELLKQKRKRFPRRKVFVSNVDSIWTADLLDIHKFARVNKGYKFILVVLDVFSRYAWARPLKNKTGDLVANAFQDIFTTSKRKPARLWVDRGTEFYNNKVSRLLKDKNIEIYSTHNEPKATIAERFIRTLRGKIESNFILTQSTVWYDILPQLVHEYNTTKHKTLKMTPEEACQPGNFAKVFKNLYPPSTTGSITKSRFSVGDKVRISINKSLFTKGATANWSEEIFTIKRIRRDTNPVVYELEDLAGEEVKGGFYNEQLQKTSQEIYRVDKIIRKRGNEVLVKWSGYPDKFNSWMPSNVILRSGQETD